MQTRRLRRKRSGNVASTSESLIRGDEVLWESSVQLTDFLIEDDLLTRLL